MMAHDGRLIRVGNAPCSWGSLEWQDHAQDQPGYARMLDELSATGYTGTELGDWGFMPTDPQRLAHELTSRSLTMTGAFVPVAFANPDMHKAGAVLALQTAKLVASVQDPVNPPFIVLADDNCSVPIRTLNAGRITPDMSLKSAAWQTYGQGVNMVAQAVSETTGLRCVFHPHCGGWVESPEEIDALLEHTDANVVGLVFDTGHYTWGAGFEQGGDIGRALDRYKSRIAYVHLKDCQPDIAQRAVQSGWGYHDSVRNGVFCELGNGRVNFREVVEWLTNVGYSGFVTVEQDVLPGMGMPKESAARNRKFLREMCGI